MYTTLASAESSRSVHTLDSLEGLTADNCCSSLELQAHKEFERSFNLCSHKVSFRNRRLILVRLATTSLLLGIIPARSLLQSFGLWDAFRPLIYGIRHGDLDTFREALGLGTVEYAQERAEYFRTYKILGILQEKGEVLVWRSLLRKT